MKPRLEDPRALPPESPTPEVAVAPAEIPGGKIRRTGRVSLKKVEPPDTELARLRTQIAEQARLLDLAQEAALVLDLKGRILSWNKGAERIYGWAAPEVAGRGVAELLFFDPSRYVEISALILETGEWCGDLAYLRRDHTEIMMETRWSLLRDGQGRPKSILAVKTDVTDKRNLELQLIRAQRMASLGLLAGGIAHDLNNVLTPIMLSIDVLKGDVTDPQLAPMLDTIEMSVRRGSDIVQQALSFARGMEGQRMAIHPRYMLQEIEHIIRDTFPKDIRLKFDQPRDTWMITGDPTQLQQVLLNLSINARDAMPSGGTLSFETKNHLVDDHFVAMNPQARPGMYVALVVTDTGTGMPPEIVAKIFEPFFTTKAIGQGTGLGLASVQTIVQAHAGFINVYSEPGRGTSFKVYFPAQPTAEDHASQATPKSDLPRGAGQTILVVDDEPSILAITRQTLDAFGYRYLTAKNGAEAIALYATHRADIHVILTDLTMPIMDGTATIYALQQINPQVKIVTMSGLDESSSILAASKMGIHHFLAKPYTASALLRTLKSILAV